MLIILKKVTISALGLAALLPLAGAEWRVESPLPGILELANDGNQWGGLNPFDVLPCNGSGCIAKKEFPLDKLPAGSLEKADKVYLKLHIGVFDDLHYGERLQLQRRPLPHRLPGSLPFSGA